MYRASIHAALSMWTSRSWPILSTIIISSFSLLFYSAPAPGCHCLLPRISYAWSLMRRFPYAAPCVIPQSHGIPFSICQADRLRHADPLLSLLRSVCKSAALSSPLRLRLPVRCPLFSAPSPPAGPLPSLLRSPFSSPGILRVFSASCPFCPAGSHPSGFRSCAIRCSTSWSCSLLFSLWLSFRYWEGDIPFMVRKALVNTSASLYPQDRAMLSMG